MKGESINYTSVERAYVNYAEREYIRYGRDSFGGVMWVSAVCQEELAETEGG